MDYRITLLLGVFILGACSYSRDTSMQELRVETPGAQNAICYVSINNLRYKYRPPQTMTISKSREDMVIRCLAPGNRTRKVVIEPSQNLDPIGNAFTGILPGLAWDYASNAAFSYPELVEVDFTGAPLVPEALPQHNSPDIRQPEDYDLEEFRPSTPRLNEDRDVPVVPLRKRVRPGSAVIENEGTVQPMGKGDLESIIGKLFGSSSESEDDVATTDTATTTDQSGGSEGAASSEESAPGDSPSEQALETPQYPGD